MFPIDAARRQAGALRRVEHRPWPLPAGRWALGQTWDDLLFAHWRVPLETVRRHVPRELEVELHDGSAWLGITPFRLSGLRGRGLLPLPGVSSFRELNVRTYVRTRDEKPGIWFFSLDASSRLAVEAARRAYRLPYFHARIAFDRAAGWTDVECTRLGERGKVFSGRYRPAGDPFEPSPGSLEWFLAERYCLYASDGEGRRHRAEIHHAPWRLRPAEAEVELTSIAPFALQGAPLCHLAERQDVLIWPLERVPATS
ncbi:MAG TPA: DUF2071 domain-containing protein [Gaiellaceae bacterium]|nr:DUF2071 domain-containing protein [Gaiellaceae bacterium]